MTGAVAATGPCWLCGEPFSFNPDLVPTILIDPVVGTPPDIHPDGDTARAVSHPMCPGCVTRANTLRRDRGLPLWREGNSLDWA